MGCHKTLTAYAAAVLNAPSLSFFAFITTSLGISQGSACTYLYKAVAAHTFSHDVYYDYGLVCVCSILCGVCVCVCVCVWETCMDECECLKLCAYPIFVKSSIHHCQCYSVHVVCMLLPGASTAGRGIPTYYSSKTPSTHSTLLFGYNLKCTLWEHVVCE